jgi:putative heme-binding domain-containing protein
MAARSSASCAHRVTVAGELEAARQLSSTIAALTDPGAAIAHGYGTVRVQMKDGRTLRGFARNEGNHVLPLQTLEGRLVAIDKDSAQVTPEPGSLMPALSATADEQRDLTAYLSRLELSRSSFRQPRLKLLKPVFGDDD